MAEELHHDRETIIIVERPWYTSLLFLVPVILLLGGVIFYFLFDNVLMPFYVKSGEVATVPPVVGLKADVATKRLSEAGYEPVQYEIRFSDSIAEGVIIRQTPEGGEETKPGRKVFLILSGGREMVIVPDLHGKSLRDAKMLLLKDNIMVGQTDYAYSDSAAYGTVFRQSPGAGTKISTEQKVNLFISQGSLVGRVVVPDCTGLLLSEAIAKLNNAELTLGKVTFQSDPSKQSNTVIEQYPRPGDLVVGGSTIDVFVARE